jgi:small-conductance mechanosensitive channel
VHRRTHHRLEELSARRRSQGLDLRPIAWGVLRVLVDLARFAAVLSLAYLTLSLVLRQFPYTRPWGETLGGYVLDALSHLGRGFVDSLPSLATLLLIWLITRGVVRVISAWFEAIAAGKIESDWFDPQTAGATRRLVVTGIWLFALTIAYPYIPGSETAAFKGVSVFVGLMLSLGSAGALSQIVSGFVVLYSRAIRVGDFVRVDDKEGVVAELGLLSLKLVTRLREEVTIPNTVLAATAVNNYTRRSRENGLFVATSVSIGYDTPWRQVHALLELAASRTPDILPSPKPYVLETGLGDFYVVYQLCAAIAKPTDRPFVLSRLHAEIQDAFNEFGVQIMSPNFEAQPDAKVWVPREQWNSAPAEKPAA